MKKKIRAAKVESILHTRFFFPFFLLPFENTNFQQQGEWIKGRKQIHA